MSFDNQGHFTGTDINIDEVRGAGVFIPAGRYKAKLSSVTGVAESKSSGKPMVRADFEITEGDYEGFELAMFYSMSISAPKKAGGKAFAPGIAELKSTLAAVNDPLPQGYAFPTKNGFGDETKAAKILGQKLNNKNVEIAVTLEAKKQKGSKDPVLDDEGNVVMQSRSKVIGLAKRATATADDEDLGL